MQNGKRKKRLIRPRSIAKYKMHTTYNAFGSLAATIECTQAQKYLSLHQSKKLFIFDYKLQNDCYEKFFR